MRSLIKRSIDQRADQPSADIVNAEVYMGGCGKGERDHSRRIEWIGVVPENRDLVGAGFLSGILLSFIVITIVPITFTCAVSTDYPDIVERLEGELADIAAHLYRYVITSEYSLNFIPGELDHKFLFRRFLDTPVPTGSVDKESQRAAWGFGSNGVPVMETGIFNLTKDETTALVHFSKDKTQQWYLVRQQQDESAEKN